MTPAELAKIRGVVDRWQNLTGHEARELLAHVDQQAAEIADLRAKVDGEAWEIFSRKLTELTGELERARATAIDGGAFTNLTGDLSEYTHALNEGTCESCGARHLGVCNTCNRWDEPAVAE